MRQISSRLKPRATRAESSVNAATVRGPARAVKMSAVTLAFISWHYGRNANAATATSISVSSKSPGSGRRSSTPLVALQVVMSATPISTMPPSSAQASMTRWARPLSPVRCAAASSLMRLLRVLGDQLARLRDERLAVDALGLDLVDPALHDRLELLLERLHLGGAQLDVLPAGLDRHADALVVVRRPDPADLARPGLARGLGEGFLHVGRQLRPASRVHRHLERGGAEARLARPLDEVFDLLFELQRRDDLPGDERAVHHLLRQRLRQVRHRHRDRRGTERL